MRTGKGGPILAVDGHIRRHSNDACVKAGSGSSAEVSGLHLVCSRRLVGYDTFLSGVVALHGGQEVQEVRVRILTFDDLTVLLPREEVPGWTDGQEWSGTLRLPPATGKAVIPDDVAEAIHVAGLDADAYDPAELTHLLTWLTEAVDPHLRKQRLIVIVRSLASQQAAEPPDPSGAA